MAGEATRFQPGQSGNPAGKPKGARNRTTLAIEALIDGAAEDIANKAIELAKAGDSVLISALLDRAAPPRRDRHIAFELPPMEKAANAVNVAAAIAQAVAAGELTPSEASELSDLEARLQRLEAANRTRR